MKVLSSYIVFGCWIFFIAYWIINARRVKATAQKQSLISGFAHRLPLVICYVLLADGYLPPPMNMSMTSQAEWALAMGCCVSVLGLFMAIWARSTLAGNWSSTVTFKQAHELIRRGPYRFVRHPIYTGILTLCLGTAIEIGKLRGWLALPLMLIAFWIKLKQEEALLLRHFPNEYPVYRKQVKALIPFVF
jgi:protein-S-isoprenylcysteine O-methyltransferase Ste14